MIRKDRDTPVQITPADPQPEPAAQHKGIQQGTTVVIYNGKYQRSLPYITSDLSLVNRAHKMEENRCKEEDIEDVPPPVVCDTSEIRSKRTELQAIAAIGRDPTLIERYNVKHEDFTEAVYKALYYKIKALNVVIKDYNELYQWMLDKPVFNDVAGLCIQLNQPTTIVAVDNLKKYTLLRQLHKQGFKISRYWNGKATDKFDEPINSIMQYYQNKIIKGQIALNEAFYGFSPIDGSEQKQPIDLTKIIAKDNVFVQYASPLLTTLTGGIKAGNLNLFSAGTGSGKSRFAIANMVCAAAPQLYVDGLWTTNPNQIKAVYFSTEMKNEDVAPMVLASITGIQQQQITGDSLTQADRNLLQQAVAVANQNNMVWEYMPDYTRHSLLAKIEQYAQQGYTYFLVDYIRCNANMLAEEDGRMREDQVLLQLATDLKAAAQRLHVAIDGLTQTNRDSSASENSIRGARSLADKCDIGAIIDRIDGDNNFQINLYKNRGGVHANVELKTHFEYGAMRFDETKAQVLQNKEIIRVMPTQTINVA